MALQRFTTTDIIVEIPDIVVQGVTLKRKAHSQSFHIEFGLKQVSLCLAIIYFGRNEDGTYGDELDVPGIEAYQRILMADMNVIVNATTGIQICPASQEYIPNPDYATDNTQPATIINPLLGSIDYMLEFELMMGLMHRDVIMYDLFVEKIEYAAQTGKLD